MTWGVISIGKREKNIGPELSSQIPLSGKNISDYLSEEVKANFILQTLQRK